MEVAAIIVTRGDQPEGIQQIVASLPAEWHKLVWDNGYGRVTRSTPDSAWVKDVPDLSVYGRYAAIEYTDAELIYVQDDDCVVSDPALIVRVWETALELPECEAGDHVVCNMPPEFRHDFYEEHALVGFGACFHRDAPQRAFHRFAAAMTGGQETDAMWMTKEGLRTCDIIFTALTTRVLVDVPKENLPWAYHETRMWKQPQHQAERVRMLDLVRQIA